MKVIGLCGGSGSGKGEVSKIFSTYGIPSIDTDEVYHRLTSDKTQCLSDLVSEFGTEILNSDGVLDRKRLRHIVFADGAEAKRSALNRISHSHVIARTTELVSEYAKEGVVAVLIDAPLLFESGLDKKCDFIISVTADKAKRASRITLRDGISFDDAMRRIDAQLDDEYLIKKSRYNITNNGALQDLEIQIKKILNEIKGFD